MASGATLAGLRLQVETAQELDDRAGEGAAGGRAGQGVATAVAEVRTICDGLRPPGLDDLGLAGALTALAARMASPASQVDGRTSTTGSRSTPPWRSPCTASPRRPWPTSLRTPARHGRSSGSAPDTHVDLLVRRRRRRGLPAGGGAAPDGPGAGVDAAARRGDGRSTPASHRRRAGGTEVRPVSPRAWEAPRDPGAAGRRPPALPRRRPRRAHRRRRPRGRR